MNKTPSQIIHEINEHIKAISAALDELEQRVDEDAPTTVPISELAQKMTPLHIS